jgi:hypothetical protein
MVARDVEDLAKGGHFDEAAARVPLLLEAIDELSVILTAEVA